MTDLPTFEDAVAKLKDLPPDKILPNGKAYVGWGSLAYVLFEKGSPHWKRPVGKPHGKDQSPAVNFMQDLQFSGQVETIRLGGTTFFRVKK